MSDGTIKKPRKRPRCTACQSTWHLGPCEKPVVPLLLRQNEALKLSRKFQIKLSLASLDDLDRLARRHGKTKAEIVRMGIALVKRKYDELKKNRG